MPTPDPSRPPSPRSRPATMGARSSRWTGPSSTPAAAATIDWERRHLLMRTHTALHTLCGVVWRDYRALVTGGNMEPGAGRMDFEFETMSGELVGEIEARGNAELAAEREVRVKIQIGRAS